MFTGKTQAESAEAAGETIEEAERAERVSMEADADRMRNVAFKGQEWTTKFFGTPEAPGNEYRLTHRGEYYYLETLGKLPGGKEAHSYAGHMLHERDLFAVARVFFEAAKAKKESEK